jgi:hypothetical protein
VLLDSSAFFYFCEGGQVINLALYLAKRACVTLEVDEEIRRNSTRYQGFRVYDAATPAGVGQAEWHAAVMRASAALPPAGSAS